MFIYEVLVLLHYRLIKSTAIALQNVAISYDKIKYGLGLQKCYEYVYNKPQA